MWPYINTTMMGYDMKEESGSPLLQREESKDIGGYIMVIDLENPHLVETYDTEEKNTIKSKFSNFKVMAHFKASNDGPLSIIRFDPTGTLLATASEKGNIINIFKINPKSTDIFESHQHLYILKRGVTPTIIKQISFSTDSKLIAITSAYKGTVHLYGINLQGGVVDAISHLDINHHRRSELQYPHSLVDNLLNENNTEPQESSKLAVIHSEVQEPISLEQPDKLFGSIVHFDVRSSSDYILYSLDSAGILTYNRIQLFEAENNKLGLSTNVQGIVEWDLRRQTKSRPYRFQPAVHPQKVPSTDAKINYQQIWLSNIEINTCTMPHTPFWMANDLLPLQAYTSLPNIPDKHKMSDPTYQDVIYQNTERTPLPVKESNNKLFSFY
jgi:hypothetical protein